MHHKHPLHRHVNLHPVISILSLLLIVVFTYITYLAIDEQEFTPVTTPVRHSLSPEKAMQNFANIQASLEGVLENVKAGQ